MYDVGLEKYYNSLGWRSTVVSRWLKLECLPKFWHGLKVYDNDILYLDQIKSCYVSADLAVLFTSTGEKS